MSGEHEDKHILQKMLPLLQSSLLQLPLLQLLLLPLKHVIKWIECY